MDYIGFSMIPPISLLDLQYIYIYIKQIPISLIYCVWKNQDTSCHVFRWSGGLSRWGWAQEITTGPWSRGEVLPHRINELEDDMLWSFLIILDDFWTCLSSWLMLDMLDAEWHPHEIAHFCHVKSIIVHNCSICLFTMPLPILPFPIHFRFFSPPFFLHFCSLNHQPPPHWGINMAPGVCVGGASPPMALRNCRTVGGTQRGW